MNIDYITNIENEKPLDIILPNGGFTGILQTVGCIGDSLSSGEFEYKDKDGNRGYRDMFDFSWSQFMAKLCGLKVYNFSRGGMTAKEYIESFGDFNGYFNNQYACNAYIIALGVNDVINQDPGEYSIKDVDVNCYKNNAKNFAGYYAAIISKYKEIQPRAKFFLMTVADFGDPNNKKHIQAATKHREFLYDLSKAFSNTYVLDIYKYGPKYNHDFCSKMFLGGHMNPLGYHFTGTMVAAYIDYIIRHNPKDFDEVGFIDTNLYK